MPPRRTRRRRRRHPDGYQPPLPLNELKDWIVGPSSALSSSSSETWQWLVEGDQAAAAFQAELDAGGTEQLVNLFAKHQSSFHSDEEDDDEEDDEEENDDENDGVDRSDEDDRAADSAGSTSEDHSEADYEGMHGRIRVWTSSSDNIDGVGSMYRDEESRSSHYHHRTTTRTRTNSPSDPSTPGDHRRPTTTTTTTTTDPKMEVAADPHAHRLVYVMSESWEGYGDTLWASSRYLANQFANPTTCRQLLGWERGDPHRPSHPSHNTIDHDHHDNDDTSAATTPFVSTSHGSMLEPRTDDDHPLAGRRVLELGAGCALPSLMAMRHCGAHVVITDLDDTNRIRSIAEAMERNLREAILLLPPSSSPSSPSTVAPTTTPPDDVHTTDTRTPTKSMTTTSTPNLSSATMKKCRVCPFRWGNPSEPVLQCLKESETVAAAADSPIDNRTSLTTETTTSTSCQNGSPENRFDVICTTDCLFMPWLHVDLIRGMDELLTWDDHGVILVTFAIHAGYSQSEEVWTFVPKAERHGFRVDRLDTVQMTPPIRGMEAEQGLIHVLRLTRRR